MFDGTCEVHQGLVPLQLREVFAVQILLQLELPSLRLGEIFAHTHLDHLPAEPPGRLQTAMAGDQVIIVCHHEGMNQTHPLQAVHQVRQVPQVVPPAERMTTRVMDVAIPMSLVTTAAPDERLIDVVSKPAAGRLPYVLVFADGALAGILTAADLKRAATLVGSTQI